MSGENEALSDLLDWFNQHNQIITKAQLHDKHFEKVQRIKDHVFYEYLLFLKQLVLNKTHLDYLAMLKRLSLSKGDLNNLSNKEGETLLQYCLRMKLYQEALMLLRQGAKVTAHERAILIFSLESTKGYSSENLGVSPFKPHQPLHMMKEYGLVLGIKAVSTDGTYSQWGFVGPAHIELTQSLGHYTRQLSQGKSEQSTFNDFKQIEQAFQFTEKMVGYVGSLPTKGAAGALAERIRAGKLTSFAPTCQGHIMGLSFVPDGQSNGGFLVFTERGRGSYNPPLQGPGTYIYKVSDSKRIDEDYIQLLMLGCIKGESQQSIVNGLLSVVDSRVPVYHIRQSSQKHDNCSIANPRSNIEGILFCQQLIRHQELSLQALSLQEKKVKSLYKGFTHDMREQKVKKLISELNKQPPNPDCVTLAKCYLEQHPDTVFRDLFEASGHTEKSFESSRSKRYR